MRMSFIARYVYTYEECIIVKEAHTLYFTKIVYFNLSIPGLSRSERLLWRVNVSNSASVWAMGKCNVHLRPAKLMKYAWLGTGTWVAFHPAR